MFRHIKSATPGIVNARVLSRSVAPQHIRMVHQITSASEFKEVTAKGPVVVDFFATWCGPCKMVSPLLEKLDPQYPGIKVVKLDIEEVPEIASEFQVSSIPTFLYFNDGKIVNTVRGAAPAKIKEGLDQLSK